MNLEGKEQSLLTFRVGPVLCCAPSLPVRSIITPPKLTHVAGSEPSTPGIFKHGSHIVKVIDLRLKFGVDPSEHTHPGNLVISISEAGDFAFWVDQIIDVFDFPSEGWGNLPPAIPRGIFTRTLLLNNKIHLYSEFEKLASISDLGYLEHYIQQLTNKDSTQTRSDESKKTASLKASSQQKTEIKKQAPDLTADKAISSSSAINKSAITKNKSTQDTTAATTSSTIEQLKLSDNKPSAAVNSSPVIKSGLAQANIKSLAHKTVKNINLPETKKETVKAVPLSSQRNSGTNSAQSSINTASNTASRNTATTVFSNRAKVATSRVATSRAATSSNSFESITQKKSTPGIHSTNNINEASSIKNNTMDSSKQNSEDEDEQSYFGIILFFIVLLLLAGAGIYYFFIEEDSKPYQYKKETYTSNIETKLNTTNDITEEKHQAEPEPVTKIQEDFTPLTETATKEETETTTLAEESEQIENADYRADITQDEGEITITIHQPSLEEITEITEPVEAVIEAVPIEEGIEDEAVIETAPVKTLQADELSQPVEAEKVINEIVHTVVKGDTLWAIAKKYVKDPFLYPELARLSNIKNPHRIYPGNRVRIRFTKN